VPRLQAGVSGMVRQDLQWVWDCTIEYIYYLQYTNT